MRRWIAARRVPAADTEGEEEDPIIHSWSIPEFEMLKQAIMDEGSTISGLLAIHRQIHQSHGVPSSPDCTSLRQHRQFLPACRLCLTSSIGDSRIQVQMKPKRDLRKCSVLLAELKAGYESRSRKVSAYNGTPNASIENSVTNLYHDNAYVRSDGSHHKSEVESKNCVSFHEQEVSEPIKHVMHLLDKLQAVHLHLLASEQWNASQLKLCHRIYSASATNLSHYLALVDLDVQQLSYDLASVGLPDLNSINSYVLASINAGILLLENLVPDGRGSKEIIQNIQRRESVIAQENENMRDLTINTMKDKASLHAAALFGPSQGRTVRIMVTIGKEVISNEMLITDLLKAGASVFRINCAHGDPSIWSEIIRIARHNSQLLEKPCRILMDLAGPKLRTGLLMMDQTIMKISPRKDTKRGSIFPAQVWLCSAGSSLPTDLPADAILCVEQKFLNKLKAGNSISFTDIRGKKRTLKLRKGSPLIVNSGYMVECTQTAYIGLDTKFCIKMKNRKPFTGQVLNMPAVEQSIMLRVGDLLTISRSSCLPSTTFDSARITCSSDLFFDCVKPGEPIAFDDGKIWGKIQVKNMNEIIVLITYANPTGSKLESEKSINIPKSEVLIKGLTSKDVEDLDFIGANADMVGVSFIRDVTDMVMVQNELEKQMLKKLGIVLKIETSDGFKNMPLLLYQAMQFSNPLGVMIARGDLMVECGWDKMANIQEEILSICSAAHVPVIWATRVLESLIKCGMPTRAEITDVVGGMRASCVMLNKGEHIVEAVSALDSMLCNCTTKNKKAVANHRLSSSCLNQ